MDIILFGIQGSGKGTQGKILAERYGLKVFDMGSQLRSMIESGSELGQRIKDIVERGDLVDDVTIIEVIESFIANTEQDVPVLFDGIPRTVRQSEGVLKLLTEHGRESFALLVKISKDEAIKRLTSRRVCNGCKSIYPAFFKESICSECGGELITRKDDSNLDIITTRLEGYENETTPVIKHFYEQDRLIEVDGEQSIQDVTEEMIEKAGYLFS